MTAILSSLKLVNAKRQNTVDPIQFRRNKLSEKLTHQINLAKALKNGETYTVKRQRNVRDEASGLTSVVEVSRKVKQWWWVQGSKVCVQLRYGSRIIALTAKGDKNSVEVSDANELISALETLKSACEMGELDQQIDKAAEAVKSRFLK